MDGWIMSAVPPLLSAIQAREDSSERTPAVCVSARKKYMDIVSKTGVSCKSLVISCEIPGVCV